MVPTYQALIKDNNLRMLVFSGDIDAIVPVTGTRAVLASMNLTVTQVSSVFRVFHEFVAVLWLCSM